MFDWNRRNIAIFATTGKPMAKYNWRFDILPEPLSHCYFYRLRREAGWQPAPHGSRAATKSPATRSPAVQIRRGLQYILLIAVLPARQGLRAVGSRRFERGIERQSLIELRDRFRVFPFLSENFAP